MSTYKTPTGRRSCPKHGTEDIIVMGTRNPQRRCGICYREYQRERYALRMLAKEPGSLESQFSLEARMTLLYEVTFTCAHTNNFIQPAPEVGGMYHCNYCGDWKKVVKVAEGRRRKPKRKTKFVGKA